MAQNDSPTPKQDTEFLSSKTWKKGFLGSNKSEKKEKPHISPPNKPSGLANDSRTARGILKSTHTQPKPPTQQQDVFFNSTSSIQSIDPLISSKSLHPNVVSESVVTTGEEKPPPEEKKRVSKFMAERMGGVTMIADMNSSRTQTSTSKSFTGKIVERG